jgi:hypothetical protein
MNASEIAVQVFQLFSPALVAVSAWLATRLAKWITARVQNETLRGVLLRLNDTVVTVVRELEQVTVETLRKGAPGGRLTPELKLMLRRSALAAIKHHLGARGVAELARVFDLDGDGLDRLLATRVEATVHELKQVRLLNGHARPGGGEPPSNE